MTEPKAANDIEEESITGNDGGVTDQNSLSRAKTGGNCNSRYDGILLAKPRRKGVVTNGVTNGRARGSRPRRNGRESIVGNGDTRRLTRTSRLTSGMVV